MLLLLVLVGLAVLYGVLSYKDAKRQRAKDFAEIKWKTSVLNELSEIKSKI